MKDISAIIKQMVDYLIQIINLIKKLFGFGGGDDVTDAA